MKCPKCGAECQDGTAMCPACGVTLRIFEGSRKWQPEARPRIIKDVATLAAIVVGFVILRSSAEAPTRVFSLPFLGIGLFKLLRYYDPEAIKVTTVRQEVAAWKSTVGLGYYVFGHVSIFLLCGVLLLVFTEPYPRSIAFGGAAAFFVHSLVSLVLYVKMRMRSRTGDTSYRRMTRKFALDAVLCFGVAVIIAVLTLESSPSNWDVQATGRYYQVARQHGDHYHPYYNTRFVDNEGIERIEVRDVEGTLVWELSMDQYVPEAKMWQTNRQGDYISVSVDMPRIPDGDYRITVFDVEAEQFTKTVRFEEK